MDSKGSPDDPLGLEAVDRQIRINELEEQLETLGMSSMHVSEDCPPELHEEFLRNIAAYESAPLGSHFEALKKSGVELPDPDSMDDQTLYTKLWEVIHALSARDTTLYHTDHLSDRQLYERLWRDTLREETMMMPPGSGWHCGIDLIGSGSDEDIEIGLRYYDTEEQRGFWAKDFPSMVIPPHEDPPYDRDRHLPRSAADNPGWDDSADEDESTDE